MLYVHKFCIWSIMGVTFTQSGPKLFEQVVTAIAYNNLQLVTNCSAWSFPRKYQNCRFIYLPTIKKHYLNFKIKWYLSQIENEIYLNFEVYKSHIKVKILRNRYKHLEYQTIKTAILLQQLNNSSEYIDCLIIWIIPCFALGALITPSTLFWFFS